MELHPPLHLGVVAIEKGAFGSHLTKVANFTLPVQERTLLISDFKTGSIKKSLFLKKTKGTKTF